MVVLNKYVQKLIKENGGLRAASRVLQIDNSYLNKMATGIRTDPSDEVLKKLKLRKLVMYVPKRRKKKVAKK